MMQFQLTFKQWKKHRPAVVAKASRAAIRATPAAHVKTPCLRREMFHGVRAYAAILHSMKSLKDTPWSTPLAGPATIVTFAPGSLVLIYRDRTNHQDASSELDLRHHAFSWRTDNVMLQKKLEMSNLHPHAPPCSRSLTSLAMVPTTASSEHGSLQ